MTKQSLAAAVLVSVLWTLGNAEALRFDFSPSPLLRLLQRRERSTVVLLCPRSTKRPKIDGKLDDQAWLNAAAIERFVLDRPATEARLCFDKGALYIGVECAQLPDRSPEAKVRPRDGPVYGDDCIEVWIDPGRKGKLRYGFVVNAAGSFHDQIIRGSNEDPSYNPRWSCAANRGKGKWTVEIAIPMAALQLRRWPKRIGFNIGRNGPGLQPHAWCSTYGDTSRSALVFQDVPEGVTAAQEEEAQPLEARRLATAGASLRMTVERPFARPGDRWIEARLYIRPKRVALDKTRVTARLFELGKAQPVAEASAVPERPHGTLWVDLRQKGLTEARVSVELFEEGQCTGAVEAFLSARDTEVPFRPGQKIAIKIDPPAGIDGVKAYPVTFGVPFPAGALWDTRRLRLTDRVGREIPSQREVTGLWSPEGAIKWVRFDALVSSEDGCFVEAAAAGPRANPATPVHVSEREGKVVVETGVARYVLAKGSSPIQEIWLGGNRVATSSGTRGLYVVDQTGRVASASADGETMVVEARGPVAACVRFEGFYRTPEGEPLARHITRVEAFAGRAFANITHTLILTNDTNKVWFKDIGWEFAVDPGTDPQAVFGISRAEWAKSVTQPLNFTGASAFMIQDSHFRFAHGKNHFYAAASAAGGKTRRIAEGEECGDWAVLAGSRAGLMLSCREAARQHPKEFEISQDKIVLHLFSNRAGEDLDFRAPALVKRWNLTNWYDHALVKRSRVKQEEKVSKYTTNAIGWAKTHQLLVAPVPAQDAARKAARLSRLRSAPVYGCADPWWIYNTEAMGRIHPKDTKRFPEAEKVIEETFKVWERRVPEWGEYGFVDYFAGPHMTYRGRYAFPWRYCYSTYTLRTDLWLLYARSGDRNIRDYAAGSNRSWMDNVFCHWDGNGKVRGLYVVGVQPFTAYYDIKECLPFYWEGVPVLEVSSASNLENFIWDYHLTGYRRAKDHVLEYADGMKRFWSPAVSGYRILMVMRLAAQAYAFTWDPELRAIAEATTDTFTDAEGEIGLTKNRPYRSSTYKTQVDIACLLEAWQTFGTPRYYELSMKVSRFWWKHFLASWPIFYCSPVGRIGNFLYHETGDPSYAQVLAVKVRQASSAYDPKSGGLVNTEEGMIDADSATFLFQGIPYAQDVLARTNADRKPVAAWVSYEDCGYPCSIIVRKGTDDIADIDLKTASEGVGMAGKVHVRPVQTATKYGVNFSRALQKGGGVVTVRIPKDAPGGEYEIVPSSAARTAPVGQSAYTHFAVAHSRLPLVLYAPKYWRPMPTQAPPVRWYFAVPKDGKDAQIFFEGATKLFDPQGGAWLGGKSLKGWIDLPADNPGLWSFEPSDCRLVRVRNVPPFFAVENPKSYFTPNIPWRREPKPPPPEDLPPDTIYVPGAITTPGNQALYLRGRRAFCLKGGPNHPSGDGSRFLPFRQGTIEFFVKTDWGTFDLPAEAQKHLLTIQSARDEWYLAYEKRVRPAKWGWSHSHILTSYVGRWRDSHVLTTCFMTRSRPRSATRTYRRTIIDRGEWTHIAWVWETEDATTADSTPGEARLWSRVFVNGRQVRHFSYTWKGPVADDMPKLFRLGPEADAAYDELRISGIPRYRCEFAPPPRDMEFPLDGHTRALFHFNGDIQGESHGHTGPVPVELKPQ